MAKTKNPIKYRVELNTEQLEVKKSIYDNQIVVVTGNAGVGKTLNISLTALDMLFTKEISEILVTRAAVEVGGTLGYLKGSLEEKFSPYTEAVMENIYKCYDRAKIDKHVGKGQIKGIPVQFIRGKTIESDQILIVEEAQNLSKAEMLAILTRVGKNGRIVISGDNNQNDTKREYTGLSYAIELSKNIQDIKFHNLTINHRSDLVGKILEYENA